LGSSDRIDDLDPMLGVLAGVAAAQLVDLIASKIQMYGCRAE
jgi:hypothetical protein